MKVYLYYSKNKIFQINNSNSVKQKLSKQISEKLNQLEIRPDDIEIKCVNMSDDIDIYLILALRVSMNSELLAERMDKVRDDISEIIQSDQQKELDLKIKSKIDPSYSGIVTSHSNVSSNMLKEKISELDYEQMANEYIQRIKEPSYSFDRVILDSKIKEKIEEALGILEYGKKVFEEWGLYEIQPRPSSALSFFGPSGTGKTMAAEAVAQKLGKKILEVSYADVESKYHGEGPKRVKAIFIAAEKKDAVLFFDEADSLLSKRLTNVSEASGQAINSMRSQLLTCLEEFRGIVIFATNLVVNYDNAFLTRLISVEFKNPDVDTRKKIWDVHIKPVKDGSKHKLNIPLASDVNTQELAERFDFVGREIRNVVISACISAAMHGKNQITQDDFIKASEKIIDEKKSVANAKDHTVNKKNEVIKQAIEDKIKEGGIKRIPIDVK